MRKCRGLVDSLVSYVRNCLDAGKPDGKVRKTKKKPKKKPHCLSVLLSCSLFIITCSHSRHTYTFTKPKKRHLSRKEQLHFCLFFSVYASPVREQNNLFYRKLVSNYYLGAAFHFCLFCFFCVFLHFLFKIQCSAICCVHWSEPITSYNISLYT